MNEIEPSSLISVLFLPGKFVYTFVFSALSRKRIDLMSMLGVYVVMGVGLVLAFLTLIAEIVWKRKEKLKSERFVQNNILLGLNCHASMVTMLTIGSCNGNNAM